MNQKLSNIFWGVLLVVAGGIALAQTQGYLGENDPVIWMVVFAGVSVVSLIVYFVSGIQNWGMLFPAGIFGALAFLLMMATNGVDNPAMAAPLFVGIGLPFAVAYVLDRTKNWWALIPMGVMAFLAFVVLVVENLGGEVIGSALFFILAATFGAVYFSRRALWAGFVAYIMFIMGFMPLLAMTSRPELGGVVMLFGIGLPFLLVYLRSPDKRWWAIIPAGVVGTAGVVTAIVLLPGLPGSGYDERIANVIMYVGVAATFAVIGWRHHKPWGMLFALVAAVIAVASAFTPDLQRYWPVFVVLAGFYLLYNAVRPKTA